MDKWTQIIITHLCRQTHHVMSLILHLGWRMLVHDEPHTSAMDLSQTASSFMLCHPHGNYYLVTFLHLVVGGRRSLRYEAPFLQYLQINVQIRKKQQIH